MTRKRTKTARGKRRRRRAARKRGRRKKRRKNPRAGGAMRVIKLTENTNDRKLRRTLLPVCLGLSAPCSPAAPWFETAAARGPHPSGSAARTYRGSDPSE